MTLLIDVSDALKVRLSAEDKQHVFLSARLSEQLLPELKKFLKKNKIKLNQLSGIDVKSAPDHFSRTRTAVAAANGLAFALDLKQKKVEPLYSRGPNITIPK